MEYEVNEIRHEDLETGVENQEVSELSIELLSQVGGGNVDVTL